MEQKLRYEYTYFLHTFKVKNYEKYLLSLIRNQNIEKTKFEKEKDLDIYSYFTPKMKTILFADFFILTDHTFITTNNYNTHMPLHLPFLLVQTNHCVKKYESMNLPYFCS